MYFCCYCFPFLEQRKTDCFGSTEEAEEEDSLLVVEEVEVEENSKLGVEVVEASLREEERRIAAEPYTLVAGPSCKPVERNTSNKMIIVDLTANLII